MRIEPKKLIYKDLPEKGKPSILIGLEMETQSGYVYEYYPKYRDIFQLLSWFFKKEDKRYPRSSGGQGRDYLMSPLWRLAFGDSVSDVLKMTELEDDPLPEEERK